MKTSIKATSLFVLLILVISSCSKEKRYENKLTHKGGLWTISEYKCQIENDSTSIYIAQESSGTIQFSENGTYTQNLTLPDTTIIDNGTWESDEYSLILQPTGKEKIIMGINEISRKKVIVKSRDINFYTLTYAFYAMSLKK